MNKEHESGGISLLEAIETLSTIAEIDVDPDIGIADTGDIVIGERRAIEWLNMQDEDETVRVIRDIFSLIYTYLRSVYSGREPQESEHVIEGIKTIMVLVGEAAKKLDKYTAIFHWTHNKITELREYRKLQQFYQSRIAQQFDTRMLSRWILGLAQQKQPLKTKLEGRVKQQSSHVFVDLEAVKKDSEYELFYIRKEDGTRFFNPQLVRNITLVCDFGGSLSGKVEEHEQSLDIRQWQDRRVYGSAKAIRDHVAPLFERFYRETSHYKNRELVSSLQHALMALMLSCNNQNFWQEGKEKKSCFDYFADFLYFLRASLCTRDYQKMVAYPPNKQNRVAYAQLDMVHALCYAFFLEQQGEQELLYPIQETVEQADQELSSEHVREDTQLWNGLAYDYAAMSKLMRHSTHSPLIKILNSLQDGEWQFFDPIWQHDLPCQLYSLYVQDKRITSVRMPCPVHQEFVNKAVVNEEFKAFIRSLQESPITHKHLVINFQDRTSWREHSRCSVMEDLQHVKDFKDHLVVVTMTKDSDFYHQNEPYQSENHASVFIQNFIDHLEDDSCGFFFPEWIKEGLSVGFFHGVADAVHRIFFNEKNVLTREQRCDFIEICYLFFELKLLEIVKPESFTLMCKDGVDVSSISNVLLFSFLKLLNQEEVSLQEIEYLRMMMYAPALVLRERVVIQDRFNRMINALRTIEGIRKEYGAKNFKRIIQEVFGRFYALPMFETLVVPAHPNPTKIEG